MVQINDTGVDTLEITFHRFPSAPTLHYIAINGETAGYVEVAEIGLNKNGHFRALWRARATSVPKPKTALFHEVGDAIAFIVEQHS